ncbi:MAG: glycosyltransferase family 39 protein, partial [Acidobacteria bacterium]|nr:glycosyltransferase family 39 protein [Acidobacteriota bacterium]
AAARFAASGRIVVAPELRFPAFPWLNEVLFAAAMRLQDDVAAQLLECAAYLGTAVLLWEMGRRRWGAWAGALGAALWLGSPLAAWAAASAYVEPLLALFLLAAVEALLVADESGEARAAIVAGALAGCAAAVKYQGLFAVGLVAAWGLRQSARRAPPVSVGPGAPPATVAPGAAAALVLPLLAAAAVALPWYVWIGATTGDPLFPLLTKLGHPALAGVPAPSAWHAWRLGGSQPWRTLRQEIWPYPPGSPLLWLLAPLPLWCRRRLPLAARLGAAGLALALLTASIHADARMLAVAGPLFAAAIGAVVAAWSLARWGAAGAAPRLLAIGLVALLPGWCYTALLAARRGAIPHDPAARESYLRRQLPGYGALSWLNSVYGRRYAVYGLWAENLRYYAAGRFIGDWYGAAPFAAALRAAGRPADLRAFLVTAGADHLLVRRVPGQPDPVPCGDPRFAAVLRAEHCDGEASVWAVAAPRRVCVRRGPKGTNR